MSNESNVPLLNQETLDSTHSNLISLANIVGALKNGKLPTNDQAVNLLKAGLNSDILSPDVISRSNTTSNTYNSINNNNKLSKRGKELVVSVRELDQSLIRLLLEKNDDDKLQEFIFQAKSISNEVEFETKSNLNLPSTNSLLPSDKELSEVKESLKNLLYLFLTSNQLRDLAFNSVQLIKDFLLSSLEQVSSTSIEVTKTSKRLEKKLKATNGTNGNGVQDLEAEYEKLPSTKDLKKRVGRGAEDLKDNVIDNLQQKTKEVREFIDEKLPTDGKDAILERLKAIVEEVQSSPQYEESVNSIISLIKKYSARSKSVVKEAAASSSATIEVEIKDGDKVEEVGTLFREIIERFTGPLDSVFQTLNKVIEDIDNDPKIKSLFNSISAFIDRALSEPNYITSTKAQRRAEVLYDRIQALVESNADWKKDTDRLVEELNSVLETVSNDRALIDLSDKFEVLGTKLNNFTKESFNLIDGSGIWSDISSVFLPRLLSALKEIPLPRVEYISKDVDLVIDNVRFTSASFIPDLTHFTSTIDLINKKGPVAYHSHFNNTTTLSIGGLRLQAKDISYYINKKTGWIGLEDAGLLDIFVGSQDESAEDGLDIVITLEKVDGTDNSIQETYFIVKEVKVTVEGFKIKVHHSQHFIRNFLARPALRSYLESSFVSALEQQITQSFKSLDQSLYAFLLKSQGALSASTDPAVFIQALFSSTFSSTSNSLFSSSDSTNSYTKIGSQGEYILNIGVSESNSLIKKNTGLGLLDEDVLAKRKSVEGLMEEGRARFEEGVEEIEGRGENIAGEFREADRRENGKSTWTSSAFDL